MRYAMGAHGGSVYLVALAQTRSEHDAQDVAQDVFCRLLTDATAFTSDEHLRAWLLRVTVNRCRELHRMPWRRRVDALYDAYAAPSDQGAVNKQIWRAFDLVAVCAAEEFAQRMAGVELTLSASLANGSVQTRRYRFDPVEDARERYAAYLGQITDLELQREVEGTDASAQVQRRRPVTCDGPPNDTKGLSLCLFVSYRRATPLLRAASATAAATAGATRSSKAPGMMYSAQRFSSSTRPAMA